ncbi:MAG: zinc ribbon domain-containing protein [Eubacteriales bacterium]|nr:zinc ribbon domain-containing protein [Eubacteriales bacterium]
MKCLNCGINYDDGDRECPVCGTRAGKGRRANVPHYTSYEHKRHDEQSCTHRTFTKDVTFNTQGKSGKPIRDKNPQEAAAKARKWAVAAVIVIALLSELLPAGIRVIRDFVEDIGYGSGSYRTADLPAASGQDEYDPDEYPDFEYVPVMLGDLLGAHAAADLPGGMALDIALANDGEYETYELTLRDESGVYTEYGDAWCVYNYPEEELYAADYPPERYDSFTFCLTPESMEYERLTGDGVEPEWYVRRREYDDLWLLAYIDKETDAATIEDADGVGLFNYEQFVQLQRVQNG